MPGIEEDVDSRHFKPANQLQTYLSGFYRFQMLISSKPITFHKVSRLIQIFS